MTVTDFNILKKEALLNIKYFTKDNLHLKGCRKCDKLVKHNHTNNPRFKKENTFVYICECAECNTPMLLDGVDFYLLNNRV